MMTSPRNRVFVFSALAMLGLIGPRWASAGPVTYLALGDSQAFGVGADNTDADVSDGDRGYVGLFADFLATSHGGVRPDVINLAVSGETSASFFQPGGGIVGPSAALRNTNYGGVVALQNDLLLATIAQELGAGREIGHVTVSLGSNDLFALALDPTFGALPPDQQMVRLGQTLQAFAVNLSTLLTEVRSIPGVDIFVLGTYDPFPPVASVSPFAALASLAIPLLNGVIAERASAFGATYVDIHAPFVGHEAEFTFITTSGTAFNVHPTPTGYAVIAEQLRLAAVPEPSGLFLLGTGLLGVLGYGWRRGLAVA